MTTIHGKEGWGSRFDYVGHTGNPAHCLIVQNGNAILCTQAPDNDGLSITNGAEQIATAVCKFFHIPFESLIWIEHYIHSGNDRAPDRLDRPTFDLVTFKIIGDHLAHPTWHPSNFIEAMTIFERGT